MGLQVDGRDILSTGELVDLTRHLDAVETSPTFTAICDGVTVTPVDAYAALQVDLRLAATDNAAHDIIDTAVARLTRAFPELADARAA